MTSAGSLRDRVAFDRRVEGGSSDMGSDVQGDFVEQFQVAAEVRVKMGGEQVLANRLQGRQPVTITVRQSRRTREVTTDWRARDVRTGAVYNIRSGPTDPDQHGTGRGEWLELLCEVGTGDQDNAAAVE